MDSKKKKIVAGVIIFLSMGLGIFTCFGGFDPLIYFVSKEESIEFSELALRYEENLWGVPNRTLADEIADDLMASLDGLYFTDVDYNDQSRAAWQTAKHNERLLFMINYYGKDLIASDEEIRTIVIGTLNYWLKNDFKCPNWWYNEIFSPRIIAEIGIMLKAHLSESQIGKMNNIIERGIFSFCAKTRDWTGANLLDSVDNTVKYAIFNNIPYLLKKAVARAEKEIFIKEGDAEGIKPDYTFYQHGAQQAITSYGLVYVKKIVLLIDNLKDTSFQLSSDKIAILIDFILYGQRYAIRGKRTNYLASGRSYSRINGNNADMRNIINILIETEEIPKKDQLQEFYNSFEDLNYSINDTKYFPYAYTLFDISPDHYMAVKGAYDGFINSEVVNSENLLARNMGYGGLTTYQYTGYEYDNISALWDFSLLPGTTAYNETDEELKTYSKFRSSTTHSGGAADGLLGGLYVDIENEEGLYSRQAYISYNGLMICLGNTLTNTNTQKNREIFTTINQVYAINSTYKGFDIEGPQTINDNSAIFNGHFAYYNLHENPLKADVSLVTGNFNRNNLAADMEYSEEIFKLYYNFGIAPENQSFAYAVLANPKLNAPANAEGLPITRITNTNAIQAIEFIDGNAVIIFHDAGNFTTLSGEFISADTDCVKIINK